MNINMKYLLSFSCLVFAFHISSAQHHNTQKPHQNQPVNSYNNYNAPVYDYARTNTGATVILYQNGTYAILPPGATVPGVHSPQGYIPNNRPGVDNYPHHIPVTGTIEGDYVIIKRGKILIGKEKISVSKGASNFEYTINIGGASYFKGFSSKDMIHMNEVIHTMPQRSTKSDQMIQICVNHFLESHYEH